MKSDGLVVVKKGVKSSEPTDESEGYEVKPIHHILNKDQIPLHILWVEFTFNFSQIKKSALIRYTG